MCKRNVGIIIPSVAGEQTGVSFDGEELSQPSKGKERIQRRGNKQQIETIVPDSSRAERETGPRLSLREALREAEGLAGR